MNPVSFFLFRPERFLLTSRVILDHGVGRIQNDLRGPVILLQLDHTGFRIHFFKIQNIADIGAAELVDGLVVVSHHTEVSILIRQQPDQFKLRRIGILILVHHDVAESFLVIVQHLGIRLEKLHRLHDQIVKIQRVVLVQHRLILLVGLRDLTRMIIVAGRRLHFILQRADQFILRRRDGAHDRPFF